MRKDIRVVSMDAEAIAVIKKKKIQHERMRQGNARIIGIHPFVFGLIIFFLCLSKVMDGMYNIKHNGRNMVSTDVSAENI